MNKVTRNIAALIAFGFGTTSIGFAQVTQQKIGNNPTLINQSAVLEVESTNKGILTPRVTLTGLTDAVTIANPANALTVFNTATAGTTPNDVTPGYYYWSTAESRWVRLIDNLPQSVNIYNADGTLTSRRTVSMEDKQLTFIGDHQETTFSVYSGLLQEGRASSPYDGRGSIAIYGADKNADSRRTALSIQSFADGGAQLYAYEGATLMEIGTNITQNAAPIIFTTSAGGFVSGSEKMRITGEGEVGIDTTNPSEKLDIGTGNVRIRDINEVANAGNITTDKVVVADTDGVLRTVDASGLAIEPWFQATTEDKATLNTQNIYQNGNVGIDSSADNVFRTASPVAPLDVRGAVRGGQPLTTSAIGEYSAAFGVNNTASGFASMAWGYQYGAVPDPSIPSNTASGMAATAFGAGTIASGENATAFGLLNTASGDGALAFGSRNTASYSFSTAFGSGTLSEANAATAFGTRTHAGSLAETVIGINNAITTGDKNIRVDTDPLFQVGNGAGGLNAPASGAEPSNALTILKNGKTAIGVAGVEAAAKPTELLDLGGTATAGSGGLKIRNINSAAYAGNAATDKVVVADTNGVLKTVDASGLTLEPWNVQNTTTKASTNGQNIYQNGRVGIGNFGAAVTTKQLEVKGSLKAEVVDGNITYGTEIDHPVMPAQSVLNYRIDNSTGAYKMLGVHPAAAVMQAKTATVESTVAANDTHSEMSSRLVSGTTESARSTVRTESPGNFFMETYNSSPALNFGSTVSLQNDGLRMVHSTTGGSSNFLSQNGRSEILVQKAEGVRFDFKNATGVTSGQYWFPTTSGTNGQVMTQTASGKMVWATPATSTNIYNSDGTLTGNREVTMNSNLLHFSGTDGIITVDNAGESELLIEAFNSNAARTRLTAGSSDLQIAARPNSTIDFSGRPGGTNSMIFGTPNDANVASKLEFYTMGVTRMAVTGTGEVAIGATSAPSFVVGGATVQPKLHIAGDVSTTGKYYTTNSVYADYVFEKYFKGSSDIKPDYEFKSLDYVKEFIEKEHHLPGVESINNLSKTENGYTFDMTKLTVQSLEKIEELYLHTIELKEKLEVQYQIGEQQEKMIQSQQKELEELKNKFSRLEELLIKQ